MVEEKRKTPKWLIFTILSLAIVILLSCLYIKLRTSNDQDAKIQTPAVQEGTITNTQESTDVQPIDNVVAEPTPQKSQGDSNETVVTNPDTSVEDNRDATTDYQNIQGGNFDDRSQ